LVVRHFGPKKKITFQTILYQTNFELNGFFLEMSGFDVLVGDMDESKRGSSEVSRLSYQIDTLHRYRPGSGHRIVDYNGERLGVADGLRGAERYRYALSLATFDGGVRALCTSGLRCAKESQCGFCSNSHLQPFPEDGHEHYPSAVTQARELWGVGLDELNQHAKYDSNMSALSSIGAMLMAAHVRGHNCLSSAFDGVYPSNVPHDINTITGVASWAKANKYKPNKEVTSRRLLLVLRIANTRDEHPVTITHVHMIPAKMCVAYSEFSLRVSGYSIASQVQTYESALKSTTLSARVDVGYKNPLQNECISPHCNILPTGYGFCNTCGFVVKSEGHQERCRPSSAALAYSLILSRAQFGDLIHTQDVLHALLDRGVPNSERTIRMVEYQAGASQAAFMRFAGYAGSDAVLSTWFEACYDYFRSYYWEITFDCDPPYPIISLSDMHPGRLDPLRYVDNDCIPDYKVVWRHLLSVSRPNVHAIVLDDPVKVAVREVRAGRYDGKSFYRKRFTTLPDPERRFIWPISGQKDSSDSIEAACCNLRIDNRPSELKSGFHERVRSVESVVRSTTSTIPFRARSGDVTPYPFK